jgi:hypothetical protein
LPNVFSQGATSQEIRDFEDSLLLNDIVGTGNYRVATGDRRRYVQSTPKAASGGADVKFVQQPSDVKMISRDDKIRDQDDDAALFDMMPRTQQDQEQEELRILEILD